MLEPLENHLIERSLGVDGIQPSVYGVLTRDVREEKDGGGEEEGDVGGGVEAAEGAAYRCVGAG
jgi:hypothetical protein